MLPVTTGFIFPDGFLLETGGIGHRKMAFRYIVQHGLQKKYYKYEQEKGGGEDEFLIDVLGAVKICHYCGVHYMYVPKLHGIYIDSIEKIYRNAGYKVLYYNTNTVENLKVLVSNININSYNLTVVQGIDENGKKCYMYNRNREGD